MANTPKKEKPEEVETVPDAWERFEDAIGRMTPPKRKPNKSANREGGQDKPGRPKRK